MEDARPHLRRLSEFEAVLSSYKPSAEAVRMLKSTRTILLVGPTAAGRNTLISLLLKTGKYHFTLSDTTRPRRHNNGILEQDGVEYWFRSEDDVLQGLRDGRYVEAAIIHGQQVSGVRIDEFEKAHQANQIVINEVQEEGGAHYHAMNPDCLCIFLLPPSFTVWMQRLRGRGNMDDAEIRTRLYSSQREITRALADGFYTFLINHEIHDAAQAVHELAIGGLLDKAEHERARAHAEQLLVEIKLVLETGDIPAV